MKKQSSTNLFLFILIVAIIAAGFYYSKRGDNTITENQAQTVADEVSNQKQAPKADTNTAVLNYINVLDVSEVELESKQEHSIQSLPKELTGCLRPTQSNSKIACFVPVKKSTFNGKFLIYDGKLNQITNTIEMPSETLPAISSDYKWAAYTNYSNTRDDLGFSLKIKNLETAKISELDRSEIGIDQIRISSASVFYVADLHTKQEIRKVAITGGKPSVVYSDSVDFTALGLPVNNLLPVALGANGKTAVKIINLDSGKVTTEITGLDNISDLALDNSAQNLAVVSGDKLQIYNIKSKEKTGEFKGTALIGFAS